MPCADHAAKRVRARELRRAGWSRAEIAREVGVRNMRSIDRWLAGIRAPQWARRPRAKDGVRSEAVRLRREGKTYDEIRRKLGVSKSSLSLWLRDLYLTDEQRDVLLSKLATAPMRRGATNRARREAVRAGIRARAAEEISFVTDRELFLLGAILYWAEGAKAKMWRPSQCVSFINSDPRLVRLFLHWLHGFGIPRSRLSFRISIHESADLAAADRFWREIIGPGEARFLRPQLKQHVPRTNRRNTGTGYHGCLIIRVSRSTELYRQIEGWIEGIMISFGAWCNPVARRPLEPYGLGSNPSAPAMNQSTLFEPSTAYRWQSAS